MNPGEREAVPACEMEWKVGELAHRTGLTVRTLHHYDRIGLLRASARTRAGHRRYRAADAARLQQILSLRELGLSLSEIREVLDRPGTSPAGVIELHLARLRERITRQQRLCERLESIASRLRSAGEVPAEEFIQAIQEMTMFERYYTPEQLERLTERREVLGDERIRETEAEWPRLMAEVKAEMDRGTDPSDPRVQRLAERWKALVDEFTGGDPGMARSLGNLYQGESAVAGMDLGPVREMGAYLARAREVPPTA